MLLAITLKYDVVIIINVIFTVFFDCDYELRRFKVNYRRTFSILTTLKHRFLKKEDNVTNASYIFNKTNIFLISHFFKIIRLSLACLNKDICFYINVFFIYIFPSHLVVLFIYTHIT